MSKPDWSRPTARLHSDIPDMPRDLLAAILDRRFRHGDPEAGDRVQVRDGITEELLAEGRWSSSAMEPGTGDLGVLLTDDGGTLHVPEGLRVDVIEVGPRERPALLTQAELYVTAELLAELAAVYQDEPLGTLASEVAARISEDLGVSLND